MEKVACEVTPIDPGNSGEVLGVLVALLRTWNVPTLIYMKVFVLPSAIVSWGHWMWIDDWYQFASYLGITFLATDLITKLLLRKPQKRSVCRPIRTGKAVWDSGCAFPSHKVVFCHWSILMSMMKVKKYRDTKNPSSVYMRNIPVLQSMCLFSSFFQLYFENQESLW